LALLDPVTIFLNFLPLDNLDQRQKLGLEKLFWNRDLKFLKLRTTTLEAKPDLEKKCVLNTKFNPHMLLFDVTINNAQVKSRIM